MPIFSRRKMTVGLDISRGLALAAIVLVGCDRSPIAPEPSSLPQLRFSIVSGDNQAGVVNKELVAPLVVKATDAAGKAVSGVTVNFVVTSGSGRVFAGASTTNVQGMAQDYWTLGTKTSEAQTLEVRSVDPATGLKNVYGKFKARPLAGPPAITQTSLEVAFDDPRDCVVPVGQATASAPFARIVDDFGNPAAGGVVQFSMVDLGVGLGTITGNPATSGSDGKARLGSWVLGANSGPYELGAAGGGTTGGTVCFAYPTAGRSLAANPANAVSQKAGTQVALIVDVMAGGFRDYANYYAGKVTSASGGGSDVAVLGFEPGGALVFAKLGPSPGVNTFTVTVPGIGDIVLTVTGT